MYVLFDENDSEIEGAALTRGLDKALERRLTSKGVTAAAIVWICDFDDPQKQQGGYLCREFYLAD